MKKIRSILFFLAYSIAFSLDGNFSITGKSMDKNLVEVIELKNHKWFVGCQFHPEFTSRPFNGHPLFNSFIKYSSK